MILNVGVKDKRIDGGLQLRALIEIQKKQIFGCRDYRKMRISGVDISLSLMAELSQNTIFPCDVIVTTPSVKRTMKMIAGI